MDLDTRIIRIMRLVRVFRVLKLGGRYGKMQVVVKAVQESMDMLVMMMFLLALCIIIFSALVFFAERGTWNETLQRYVRPDEVYFDASDDPIPSPFPDIPRSFWWCMVTLMTVGYGDAVPITVLGKCVAACAMVVSVLIMALPISVIGTHFSNQWLEYKDVEQFKETNIGAPYFEKLTKDFKEHYFLMDDLAKKVTEIEDPILKPIMKLQERCKKQHAMHLMQEAKLRETMEPSTTGKGATPNVSQDFKERTGRSSSKGGVFDAVETIRRREVNENERLIGEMKKHDQKVYQYVDMMETLLTNDDVKLLMRTLMLNTQVFEVLVNEHESIMAELSELRARRNGEGSDPHGFSHGLAGMGHLSIDAMNMAVHTPAMALEAIGTGGKKMLKRALSFVPQGARLNQEDASEKTEEQGDADSGRPKQ